MVGGEQPFADSQLHQQAHIPGVRQPQTITKQEKEKKRAKQKKAKRREAKTSKYFGEGMGDYVRII